MANMILAHGLWTDGASVTASSSVSSSFAAANVIAKQPAQRLRFTGCASEWVQVEMTQARAVDLVAVLCSASPFAEFDILAAASTESLPDTPGYSLLSQTDPALPADASLYPTLDLDFAADSYAVGLEARERILRVFLLPSVQTWRAWRIVIRDPCNPAGHVEVNRVMLASKWQPARNLGLGWSVGFLDDSPVERTMGGNSMVTELGRLRQVNLSVAAMAEAEMMASGLSLDRLCGRRREVLFVADPAATALFQDKALYGLLSELSPAVNVAHGYWSKRWALQELV